jgi:hypothetical protein
MFKELTRLKFRMYESFLNVRGSSKSGYNASLQYIYPRSFRPIQEFLFFQKV